MDQIESVFIKDYKNFKNNYVGFSSIKLLNLVIGRNNTGKSSLLDMFQFLTNAKAFDENKFSFQNITLGYTLNEEIIDKVFPTSLNGQINNKWTNYNKFGREYLNKVFFVNVLLNSSFGNKRFLCKPCDDMNIEFKDMPYELQNEICTKIENPLSEYGVIRLAADRNISPEKEQTDLVLMSDGNGATNLIHKYINLSTLDSKVIEKKLLSTLNKIMNNDALFTDIVVQQIENEKTLFWEIFLEEKDKGRIPLSKSGSGLKTIILVLLNIFIMPDILKKEISKIIFIFEELENNLHPALQRSLFKFLKDWAIENKAPIFFTTHSHVPINLFSSTNESQIIHLRSNENGISSVVTNDHLDNFKVLNDLDVRASDIFQSNGVIWVEGPSDRIYLKKWISLYSNNQLVEGIHYQIIFYGGRLLSHLTIDNPYQESEFINLLLTNRNAAILIDSDKRSEYSKINDTKKRIKNEFEKNKSFCWITKGKEIENYLSKEIILRNYSEVELKDTLIESFEQYQKIDDFLDLIKNNEGKRFLRDKISFAHKIMLNAKKTDFENTLDLDRKMKAMIKEIKKWNLIDKI